MKITAYFYLFISLIVIVAELIHHHTLLFCTKPLLMPVLILFYILSVSKPLTKMDRLMVAALFFSWIGDVVLMLPGGNKNYFLIGLISFLITHILYVFAFTQVRDRSLPAILKQKIWLLIPLLAYLIGLISLVFPALDTDMRIPVAIYTSVIGTMVVFALNRFRRVSDRSFALVFGGAILFMISDSCIAVNKFLCHGTMPLAGVWIMGLYMAGQYLIVLGMLKNESAE